MAVEKRRIDIKVSSNVEGVTKKAEKSTKGLSGALTGVGTAAAAATGGIRAMTAALISSGIGAIVVLLGSLVGGLRQVVGVSSQFEESMARLEGISGATGKEIAKLSDQAKQLGRSTQFTASEVVELQTEFAKLGFKTKDIINVTEATLMLAGAAGTDLANAAMIAGSTLRGFGLATTETQRVTDVMAKSFTNSALDITQYQEAMKNVAPVAKTAKVSLEQATAALGLLSDRGIKGGIAGTQLRKVMSELATATGKDFRTSLDIVNERLQGATSEAEKFAIAQELVGDRAYGTLIALAENGEALDDLTGKLIDSEGAAAALNEKMNDTLRGDLKKMSSAWEGLMLSFEDGEGIINKVSRNAVQFLTENLTTLALGVSLLSGTWDERMQLIKVSASEKLGSVGNFFKRLGLGIKDFSLDVKDYLSEVPLIGKSIDKQRLEQDRLAIQQTLKRITEDESIADSRVAIAKKNLFEKQIEIYKKFKETQKELDAKALAPEQTDEFREGTGEGEDDGSEQAKLDARKKFLDKLKKMEEDYEDQTELEKIERRKQRHLAELAAMELEETEKQELKKRIEEYYNQLKKDQEEEERIAKEEQAVKDAEKADAEFKRDQEKAKRAHEEELQRKFDLIDTSAKIFGEQSKFAKALYALKLALQIKEQMAMAKTALIEAGIIKLKTDQQATEGAAKGLASGNPIKAALAVASLAATIAMGAKALSKTKQGIAAAGGVSGGIGGGSAAPAPPSFNVIGAASAGENLIADTVAKANSKPVKAYVVESEMESAGQIARNTKSIASIG